MHTFSVILLPQDAADVRGRIQELFAPYYCELEIEEYKHFFDNEYALVMAQNHGAGEDLELLVRILREKGYEDVGLENGRFYRLSTFNVNAKWDYWGIGGRYDRRIYNEPTAQIGQRNGWDEHLCANICLASLLSDDVIPTTIIMPTGEWPTARTSVGG